MSETIKVVLEAESAQFEAAMKRAASLSEKFEKDSKRANAGRTSGVGLPGLELTPAYLKNMESASMRAADLARQTSLAGASGKNGALGFLAFSQAVEDAQYGVKGVLNNIPQMVLGFGGSAGVAGVLSLAAVAAYGAYQAIQKLSGLDGAIAEAKALTAAENAFTEAMRKNRQEREARNSANNLAQKINTKGILENGGIDSATLINEDALRRAETTMEAARRARATQDALLAAAGSVKPVNETAAQQGEREWEKAKQDGLREERRLREDITARQEYLNKLASEYDRIRKGTAETDRRLTGEATALVAPIEEARQRAQDMEAELARAKEQLKAAPENTPLARNRAAAVTDLEDRIAKEKDLMTSLEAEKTAIDSLIEKTRQQGLESLKTLDTRKAATRQQIDFTQEEIKGLNAKYGIEAKLISLRALQSRQGELTDSAKQAENSAVTVQGMVDEINLMDEALKKGGEKLRQLEKEKEIRADMKALMDLGVNAIDAQILAEDRAAKREAVRKAAAQQVGGTISERRQVRSDQREEERQRRRDERVAEAAAKRAEARAKRQAEEERRFPKKDKDVGIKAEQQRNQIAKDAQKRAEDAAKARDKNIEEQTTIQKEIRESLKAIGAA